jgi:hypothetical protein
MRRVLSSHELSIFHSAKYMYESGFVLFVGRCRLKYIDCDNTPYHSTASASFQSRVISMWYMVRQYCKFITKVYSCLNIGRSPLPRQPLNMSAGRRGPSPEYPYTCMCTEFSTHTTALNLLHIDSGASAPKCSVCTHTILEYTRTTRNKSTKFSTRVCAHVYALPLSDWVIHYSSIDLLDSSYKCM